MFVLKMGQTNHNPISFHYVSFWCLCGHARNLANSPSSRGMVLKRLMDSHGMGWMTITHASIYNRSYQVDSIIYIYSMWCFNDIPMMVKSHEDAMKMWKTHGFRRNVHKWIQPYTTCLGFPHLWDSFFPGAIHVNPMVTRPWSPGRGGAFTPGPVAGVAGVAGVAVAVRLHGGSSDAMLQRHLGWAQALKHWATWPGWN